VKWGLVYNSPYLSSQLLMSKKMKSERESGRPNFMMISSQQCQEMQHFKVEEICAFHAIQFSLVCSVSQAFCFITSIITCLTYVHDSFVHLYSLSQNSSGITCPPSSVLCQWMLGIWLDVCIPLFPFATFVLCARPDLPIGYLGLSLGQVCPTLGPHAPQRLF